MSFDTFKRCLNKLPRDVEITFAGFSEPWLNPECTKMVLYSHKLGFKIAVFTTAVGMELSDVDLIKRIPFKGFFVHLPDNKEQTKIKVDKNYLRIINKLFNSNIQNISYACPGLTGPTEVHSKLKQLLKKTNIPSDGQRLNTRAGNIKIEGLSPSKKIKGVIPNWKRIHLRCRFFNRNVLLPNGDVVLCCLDWSLKHVLGNLLVSDYGSLFKSEEFLKIIKGLKDDSSDILCRYCEWASCNKRMFILRVIRFLGRQARKRLVRKGLIRNTVLK